MSFLPFISLADVVYLPGQPMLRLLFLFRPKILSVSFFNPCLG